MTNLDTELLVVVGDEPRTVTMFNSIGCEIGTWDYADWCIAISVNRIIIQAGDKFTFEGE